MTVTNTNTRIGTSTNLETGGTYDLLLMGYPDGFPEGRLEFGIDITPRKVTGVQKVVQVFVKTLMTTKGSNIIYPNQGTDFNSIAQQSNVTVDNSVLISELVTCVNDAATQTRRVLNTAGTDTNSMLSRVDIIGLETGQDSIFMALQIVTVSGVSASVAIPFPELDLK